MPPFALPLRCPAVLWALLLAVTLVPAPRSCAAEPVPAAVRALVQARCLKCHGAEQQEGEVRLDRLPPSTAEGRAAWTAVRNQLRDGLMPPEDEPPLPAAERQAIVAALTSALGAEVARLPNQGNLIAHELLFGKAAAAPMANSDASAAASPPRLWRLSPDGYKGFLRDVHRGRADGVVQPFTLIPERGLKDYSALYSIDEASTEILLRNAEVIVAGQSAHEIKDGKLQSKHDTVREFTQLMDPAQEPTRAALTAAVQMQFRLALARSADESEVERFLALYDRCAQAGDRPAAIRTMLQAVLLRADAMYRSEFGPAGARGRKMLTPGEIARALSSLLCDKREPGLTLAAERGGLATPEQVAEQVRRILYDPKLEKPGLLRFFRQYFEYHNAAEVFKDRPADKIKHLPAVLVGDTDRLILHLVEADQNVLRELLTTRLAFVNTNTKVDKSKPNRPLVLVPSDVLPPPDPKRPKEWLGTVDQVYGLERWPENQPTELPSGQRIGVLMQPSWLVAFSTNFENDPVRRGRWVRERLMGGTVPDLPIGVAAQVPDAPEQTYRERLKVTRDGRCWKCHQQMDDLGLPFEQFDHYGRFRTTEPVRDVEATAKNVDKKGQPLGPVLRAAALNTTGLVAHIGDPALDGAVRDPRELMERLARSERVRQVFVRHVFRYVFGRNESLADAPALQAADRDYVASGGSFKALLISLLSSDAYLYRTDPLAVAHSKGTP